MEFYPLESIIINKRQINFETCCGFAMGVQKYTKTHVSGGGENSSVSSWIETITEFSIQQNDGNEVQVTLTGEEIRVRDGQRVLVIWGCRKDRRCAITFVNHDENSKLYWIGTSDSFFSHLEVFNFFAIFTGSLGNSIKNILTFICVLFGGQLFVLMYFMYFLSTHNPKIALGGGIVLSAGIVLIIIFLKSQAYRVQSAWNIVNHRILKILRQLNIN